MTRRIAAKKKTVPPKPARLKAQQARSKETVRRILDSAMALMAEKGEAVTMSEIARRAGVTIGAVYRYFADKRAIDRAILLAHFDEVEKMLGEHIRPATSRSELIARVQAVYQRYFELHQRDPLFRNIWSVVQTDSALQALDVADSIKNARLFSAVARPFFPQANKEELMAAGVFLLHMAAASSRLAVALPRPMARRIRPIYQEVIAGVIGSLGRTRRGRKPA